MARLSFDEKMRLDNRPCETCRTPLLRTYGETNARWIARRYCGLKCAGVAKRQDLHARFFSKVDISPGIGPDGKCHNWTGARSANGYGAVQIDGSARPAHRIAWEIANGERVAPGLHVMHSCDNPICVNPDHLAPGTPLANMLDKTKKRRGNAPAGEQSSRAKITADDARSIYVDARTPTDIARDYPISETMVRHIKGGLAWRAATGAANAN